MKQTTKLALVGLFSLTRFAGAVSFYYSYQDAICVDEYTIKGKFILSWDDSDYADYGTSSNYYGGCMYLIDGAVDLDTFDWSADYYDYGTCVECDGEVGCSSDGTCSNFKTYAAPTTSNSYQLTQGQSSLTKKTAPALGAVAQQVADSSEALMEKDNSGAPVLSDTAVVLGLLVAAVAAVILAVAARRRKVGNKDLTSAMLEMNGSIA